MSGNQSSENFPKRPSGLAWQLLHDKEIYDSRNGLNSTIKDILGICAESLKKEIHQFNWLPTEALGSTAKITRGDNYNGKPWMVLDYPRVFEKDGVFAFRTLFLLGDAVHCTFHISGKYLERFPHLSQRLASMDHPELLLCNEGSPWIHHVNSEAYRPVSKAFHPPHHLHGFIKFGMMIPYTDWETIPEQVLDLFRKISEILQR